MESLDRSFENVCELDLVFHFDEVSKLLLEGEQCLKHIFSNEVHHILAEIIQGGLVLETNVEEIDLSGSYNPFHIAQHQDSLPPNSTKRNQSKERVICISQSPIAWRRGRCGDQKRGTANAARLVDEQNHRGGGKVVLTAWDYSRYRVHHCRIKCQHRLNRFRSTGNVCCHPDVAYASRDSEPGYERVSLVKVMSLHKLYSESQSMLH